MFLDIFVESVSQKGFTFLLREKFAGQSSYRDPGGLMVAVADKEYLELVNVKK